MKIKSPIPLTVALLPSHLADQVYDKTVTLTDALDKTGCKERGVQSMSFNCTFNVANGTQTLLILPDIGIMASILAARKLAQYDGGKRVGHL